MYTLYGFIKLTNPFHKMATITPTTEVETNHYFISFFRNRKFNSLHQNELQPRFAQDWTVELLMFKIKGLNSKGKKRAECPHSFFLQVVRKSQDSVSRINNLNKTKININRKYFSIDIYFLPWTVRMLSQTMWDTGVSIGPFLISFVSFSYSGVCIVETTDNKLL